MDGLVQRARDPADRIASAAVGDGVAADTASTLEPAEYVLTRNSPPRRVPSGAKRWAKIWVPSCVACHATVKFPEPSMATVERRGRAVWDAVTWKA
jgi:hypothetical protein